MAGQMRIVEFGFRTVAVFEGTLRRWEIVIALEGDRNTILPGLVTVDDILETLVLSARIAIVDRFNKWGWR